MRVQSDILALVGRLLLASLMLAGTVQKLLDPTGAAMMLTLADLPLWLLWPAGIFTTVAGLGIAVGVYTRPLALAAAGYCIVTSYFHYLMDDPWQMTIVLKNWTIAGGYLMLAAHGPGRISLSRFALSMGRGTP